MSSDNPWMDSKRWCELGLPKKAFDLLIAGAPYSKGLEYYIFHVRHRNAFRVRHRNVGERWTISVRRDYYNYDIEINSYNTEEKAEHVLILLALEGLRVEKYKHEP